MTKNRIKELRNSATLKITLKELSNKLKEKGLSFTDSQLSRFENGTSIPSNNVTFQALVEIFDTNIPYLLGYQDTIKESQDVQEERRKEAIRILDFLKKEDKVTLNIEGRNVEVSKELFGDDILDRIETAPKISDYMKCFAKEVLCSINLEAEKEKTLFYKKQRILSVRSNAMDNEESSIFGVPVLADTITLFVTYRDFILDEIGESIDSFTSNPENFRKMNMKKKYLNSDTPIFKKEFKIRKSKILAMKNKEKFLEKWLKNKKEYNLLELEFINY